MQVQKWHGVPFRGFLDRSELNLLQLLYGLVFMSQLGAKREPMKVARERHNAGYNASGKPAQPALNFHKCVKNMFCTCRLRIRLPLQRLKCKYG